MNYGLLSLLPPVVAVILAIWSKNVILSLFCGGFVGAMIFCGGNPFAAVHSMIGDYFFIVYIGDSATDIPCMRLVKSKGGYSIGVFDPEKNKREKVYQLFNDGRINFYAPADYSEDSELFKYIKLVIGQISINEGVKTEQRTLKNPAETYNLYITMQSLADHMSMAKQDNYKKERAVSVLSFHFSDFGMRGYISMMKPSGLFLRFSFSFW